jgi:hypothetical protein
MSWLSLVTAVDPASGSACHPVAAMYLPQLNVGPGQPSLLAASQTLLPRQREVALLEHPAGGLVKHRINAMRLPVLTYSWS